MPACQRFDVKPCKSLARAVTLGLSSATLAELMPERYTWTSSPFEEYPLAQLARVEDMSWYDPDMLVGFTEEAQQVLGLNPHLSDEIVSRMVRHVQRNINAVNDLFVERAR